MLLVWRGGRATLTATPGQLPLSRIFWPPRAEQMAAMMVDFFRAGVHY